MSSEALSTLPEPFGYFRATPFGWEDCAATDDGAQALYDEDAIHTQAARIAEIEAENGKLRDGLANGLSEKTMLTELAMRDGGLYAGIEGGAAGVLAAAFAEQFTSSGGVNYVEVSFTHPKTGPLTVTLQRCQGKTPHQLRRDAESERDQLRAELETERIRLAACGVIAMANTPESAAKARDMHPDYMSASAQDVMRAVDREMALRAEVERLRTPLTDERICELWSWSATAEAERPATTQQHAFARAIEAAKEAK